MNFQNPAALMLLVPLLGGIILLYLLRMKRRNLEVPATFLWPARTEEVRANSLFQRLRFSWLMVLQLLAVTLLVFALARPQTVHRGLAGKVTVLVLDASASMGATDVKPSRFQQARDMAAATVAALQTGDRIALVEAGPVPRVLCSLSGDPNRLRAALDKFQLYDSETDVGDSLRLAASLVGAEDSSRIVLLSDGVFEKVANFAPGKASVLYRTIGENGDNLAVNALGVAETPGGRQLFCGVRNFGVDPMKGTLTLYADGKPIDSEDISVGGGAHWGKTVAAPPDTQVFEAKVEAPKDVLAADNSLVALTWPGASLRVLLVSKGDLFLERALALDPRVTLDRAATVPADQAASYDLVVFDGVREQPVQAHSVLTFGAAGPGSPVSLLGSEKGVSTKSVVKGPLLDGVDLRSIFIGKAETVRAAAGAEVLATGTQGPLVVSSEGTQKHLYVAFEPMESDFPLQVGFPIFVANALDFLGGDRNAANLSIRAGAPCSIAARQKVTLRAPDGDTSAFSPSGGAVLIRSVNRVGAYRIQADGKTQMLYANLRSDLESNLRPRDAVSLGGSSVAAQKAPARYADFWRPIVLLALLVLVGEWWLFAKRS